MSCLMRGEFPVVCSVLSCDLPPKPIHRRMEGIYEPSILGGFLKCGIPKKTTVCFQHLFSMICFGIEERYEYPQMISQLLVNNNIWWE